MSALDNAARLLPQRLPALRIGVAIALIGAPLSWFALICAGYALSTASCFAVDERVASPTAHWTTSAMLGLLIASCMTGLLTAVYCWRELHAPAQEDANPDSGAASTRFLLRWGAIAGVAYASASALSAIGYAVLPRCAG